MMKQRFAGLGMIVLGVISTIVLDGDVTVCIIFTALGLSLVLSKELYYED